MGNRREVLEIASLEKTKVHVLLMELFGAISQGAAFCSCGGRVRFHTTPSILTGGSFLRSSSHRVPYAS